MPPTVSPITNLKNFRGNVLDRQFPVQFDPQTGMYSYDYVELTPEVTSKLKNLKYFRKSSKDLAEIESDLAAYLAKEGPPAPRAKGEITKVTEEETAKKEEAKKTFEALAEKEASGVALLPVEQRVKGDAQKQYLKSIRGKKVDYAKKQQDEMYASYNEKVGRGEAVNINAKTKRPKLSATDQARYNQLQAIVDAADYLDQLDAKEKSGVTLTAGEQTKRNQNSRLIDSFRLPSTELGQKDKNINNKGAYNAAKATFTQLKDIPNDKKTLEQRKNLIDSALTMLQYETAHPNVSRIRAEQDELQTIELLRKRVQEINAKPTPSPEDQAERTRIQANINTHNAAYKAAHPNATNESAELIPSELEKLPATRELSNEAFQARRAKAQKVLNYFTGATAPAVVEGELKNLRNNAQKIKNAFAKLNNTAAKKENQNAARNTIKKSTFLNKARKLSVATEGGRRRTRKVRRNRRKTYRRKH